ncbi:MAG: glutamate--tRNA ligase family protein, partial [Patescibacteria group bacterium]
MSTIRTRIAPSPTGFLHIGTARTALFNYLFAKKYGGTFVLRIEDTDIERSEKKFEKDIFEGLKWLVINADESPENKGLYGPYRQSERTQDYSRAIRKLLVEEKAFYCFHTEQELEQEKDELMAAKKPILHVCEYRTLDRKEAEMLTQTKPNF